MIGIATVSRGELRRLPTEGRVFVSIRGDLIRIAPHLYNDRNASNACSKFCERHMAELERVTGNRQGLTCEE